MSISVRYRLHVGISWSAISTSDRSRPDIDNYTDIGPISAACWNIAVGVLTSDDIGPIYESLLVVTTAVFITRIPATSGVLTFGGHNSSSNVRDIFNFFELCLIFCGYNLMILKVNKCF